VNEFRVRPGSMISSPRTGEIPGIRDPSGRPGPGGNPAERRSPARFTSAPGADMGAEPVSSFSTASPYPLDQAGQLLIAVGRDRRQDLLPVSTTCLDDHGRWADLRARPRSDASPLTEMTGCPFKGLAPRCPGGFLRRRRSTMGGVAGDHPQEKELGGTRRKGGLPERPPAPRGTPPLVRLRGLPHHLAAPNLREPQQSGRPRLGLEADAPAAGRVDPGNPAADWRLARPRSKPPALTGRAAKRPRFSTNRPHTRENGTSDLATVDPRSSGFFGDPGACRHPAPATHFPARGRR